LRSRWAVSSGEIVGVVIHVVTVSNLSGAAVTATVMRDDAIAVAEEEEHLRVPVVGGKRPAMAEDDRLTGAPVLVENLHVPSLVVIVRTGFHGFGRHLVTTASPHSAQLISSLSCKSTLIPNEPDLPFLREPQNPFKLVYQFVEGT
jgi:hypothetical protein